MANLVLKRFKCVEDTDEIGGESPYFITWVGDVRQGESTLKLTRKTYWDNNVSKGPGPWPVDDVVSTGLSLNPSDTLALAMMIEKDEGIDVVTSEIDAIRGSTATVLRNHEGFMASDPNFISTMRNTLEGKIKQALQSSAGADDDLMEESGHRAARIIDLRGGAGELTVVVFKGGGGRYEVIYART
jgi:hypothetical protein